MPKVTITIVQLTKKTKYSHFIIIINGFFTTLVVVSISSPSMQQKGNKHFVTIVFGILFQCSVFGQFLPDTFNVELPDHYINLTATYIKKGNLSDARKVIDLGKECADKTKDEYLTANLNYYLADYFYYSEAYDSALQVYLETLPAFEKQKDTLMLAKTYNSIGLMYSFRQDNENELKYYLLENELLDKIKNKDYALKREKVVLLTNIINHYSYDGNYEKSLTQTFNAVRLAKEIGDSVRLGSILNSQGLAYKNLGNWERSLEKFKEASNLYQALNDNFRKAFIENNIGGLYELDDRNLDSAYYYFQNSLVGFETENYQWGSTQAKLGIASVLSKFQKYEESEKIYGEIIDTTLKYKFNHVLVQAYQGISQTKQLKHDYKGAYEYLVLYNNLNDSLFNEEKHRQYAELETLYEITLKESEINVLKTEKLNQQLYIQKAKLHQNLSIIVLLLFFIIVTTLVFYYRQKRIDNEKLMQKNEEIERQNHELREKNENIRELYSKLQKSRNEVIKANNAKNRFFSILAHDLRNPFHSIMGQSFILSESLEKNSSNEQKKYAAQIYDSCNQLNRLLENLLDWSRTQTGGIKFTPNTIQLYHIVQNILSVVEPIASNKKIEIINTIPNTTQFYADPQMMETILRNLIANSIKFTESGGDIVISCVQEKDFLRISVADTGIGIPKRNINKLFKIDSELKTLGTNREKGTGLGLVICKEFTNYHKGKIWFESEVNEGSVFHVEIPTPN